MRREGGFTLVEVLLTGSLLVVILSATLSVFDGFLRTNSKLQKRAQAVQGTRLAVERLAREARNATGHGAGGGVLLRATATDVVFKAVDPFGGASTANPYGVGTVRWCLDAASGTLFRQASPQVDSPSAACPDRSWTRQTVATGVRNGARALFVYDAVPAVDITRIGVFMALDSDPARPPAEVTLSSGIFLRNQNRLPTAAFTAVTLPGRSVQLNGSASTDPEGGALSYRWADGGTTLAQSGATVGYTAPAAGTRTFSLTVTDSAGASHTTSQPVQVQP